MQSLRHQLPEKLVRRAQLAKRKAQRRLDREKDAKVKDEEHEARRAILYQRKFFTDQLVAARKARREDWELGPLAPRRDVGDQALKYGTATGYQLQTLIHPSKLNLDWKMRHLSPGKRMEKLGWKSVGAHQWEKLGNLFYENDRVAVVRGPEAGKIAVVSEAFEEEEMIKLKGVNLTEFPVPEWMKKHDGDPNPYRTHALPLPMADVRLVYKFEDRDVVLENMLLRASWNRRENKPLVKRYMPGLEEPLPDRRPEESEDHSNEPAGPDDALRITTEEVTFLPTLIQMPTPAGVIDELRNKYSKFRIRHDDNYIEKVKKKEAAEQNKQSRVQLMRTPRDRLHELVRAAAKAELQRRIHDPNTDEKIGKALWKHLTAAKQSQPTEEVRV